jgi:hypothetical protein
LTEGLLSGNVSAWLGLRKDGTQTRIENRAPAMPAKLKNYKC